MKGWAGRGSEDRGSIATDQVTAVRFLAVEFQHLKGRRVKQARCREQWGFGCGHTLRVHTGQHWVFLSPTQGGPHPEPGLPGDPRAGALQGCRPAGPAAHHHEPHRELQTFHQEGLKTYKDTDLNISHNPAHLKHYHSKFFTYHSTCILKPLCGKKDMQF